MWDKTFGGGSVDWMQDIIETSDGEYLIGGYTWSDSTGDVSQPSRDSSHHWYERGDYWVIKIDAQGNKEWDKRYGGSRTDELTSVMQTTDGGYILGGFSNSDSSGEKTENNINLFEAWIVKIDSAGGVQWDKTIDGGATGKTLQTTDGCYVIANSSTTGIEGYNTHPNWDTSSLYPSSDFWFVKFCDTTIATSINHQTSDADILIYPNPSSGNFMVELPNGFATAEISIEVMNALGQKVFSFKEKVSTAGWKKQIDLTNATHGVYFIKIKTENEFVRKKIVIVH